jgi:DNA-binding transcriptional LysR family regulator
MDPYRCGLVSTHLHYFQLVVALGSIRRAAAALNVAPSSVSRVITQLENELGTPLFERVRQRLRLTSAGELLLERGRASIAELTRATAEIDELRGLRRGVVRVATVESVARGLLPGILEEMWLRHPAITADATVTGSRQAFNLVVEGMADLAIAFDLRTPPGIHRLAASALEMGAVMSPTHPLAARSEVRLSDLSGERLLLSDASLTIGPRLREAIADTSIEMVGRSTTNSIGLMVELAARGHGVALQTRVGVENELRSRQAVFVPLRDARLRPRRLVLIARSRVHLPEAASVLAGITVQAIEQLGRL